MKTTKLPIALAVAFVTVAGVTVLAQDTPEPTKITGEIVQVMQQTRTQNAGEVDSLMIRTREGKQMRLLLGEAGSSQGQFQVGDRVQARLSAGGWTEDGYRIRSMKVRRNGESFQYRNASGELVQTQTRTRDRTGQPGSACSGANSGGGGRQGSRNGGGGGGGRR